MAPRVVTNYRTAADAQIVVLVDASVATATYNEVAVPVSPCLTTGKHNLAFTVANFVGTSVTIKLQHSYDNTNFVDVGSGTSTAIAANGTTFAATTAGVVGPFVRAVLTYVAVTSATVTVYDFVTVK